MLVIDKKHRENRTDGDFLIWVMFFPIGNLLQFQKIAIATSFKNMPNFISHKSGLVKALL
ncbi:MAG: hypothetical protein EBS49_06300 [Verrucomicrobia bacterium]|nr:hypothetical protein [Verrucomicrobiota bacterium]